MTHTPISPLVPLFIAQFLFGALYATLIHWLSVRNYLQGSTAYSVIVGNAVTLFIQWLFVRDGNSALLTFASFACTGLPMTLTYLYRHQIRVLTHKRRKLGNAAAHIRDDVVMDLSKMTHEIANEGVTVVSVVHRLHEAVGRLKSL